MSAAPEELAAIRTNQGEILLRFWSESAPNTVENFKKLARDGFYDGTTFHRVVKGFVIQGGDPLSKKNDPNVGAGGPGYTIKGEFHPRAHVRGVISMARSQDPDSAGSQFFICLGEAPSLDGQYAAFGEMIRGEEVLRKIEETPTSAGFGGEQSKPLARVVIESIRIVPADGSPV